MNGKDFCLTKSIKSIKRKGKTVLLPKIQAEISNDQNKDKGWIVYNLNPSRDMLRQVAVSLVKEPFKDRTVLLFIRKSVGGVE